MPTLTCPECGHAGEIRGTEEFFEVRGQWPNGHYPVRKCRACGRGIIVRPRFLIFGTRPVVIPDDTWSKMERLFYKEMGQPGPDKGAFPCPDCSRAFRTQTALDNHRRDSHSAP